MIKLEKMELVKVISLIVLLATVLIGLKYQEISTAIVSDVTVTSLMKLVEWVNYFNPFK